MIWIWLSILLIATGGFLSLFKKNMKIKSVPLIVILLFITFFIFFLRIKKIQIFMFQILIMKKKFLHLLLSFLIQI